MARPAAAAPRGAADNEPWVPSASGPQATDEYGTGDGQLGAHEPPGGAYADGDKPLPPVGASIFELAQLGETDYVMRLIEDEAADINAICDADPGAPSLLHIAAGFGNAELTRRLVEAGADVTVVDARGATALFSAARFAHREVVEILVYDGAAAVDATNSRGATVLHVCAQYDHWLVLGLLLELESVAMDAQDELGLTALLVAIQSGARECARLLVGAGANVALAGPDERTALHAAAARGMANVIEPLLELEEIELDAQDARGATALALAARRGHLSVVAALVDAGADVNLCDLHGWSPLHWAAKWGHAHVTAALVTAGADAHATNNDGKTASELASRADLMGDALSGHAPDEGDDGEPATTNRSRSHSRSRSQSGKAKTFVTEEPASKPPPRGTRR